MTVFWWNWSLQAKFILFSHFLMYWLKLVWAVSSNQLHGSDNVSWKLSRCPASMSQSPDPVLFFSFFFFSHCCLVKWICLAGLLPFYWCAQEVVTTAYRKHVPFQTVTRSKDPRAHFTNCCGNTHRMLRVSPADLLPLFGQEEWQMYSPLK